MRTLDICKEIEEKVLIIKDGIVGKVVRLEESKTENDTYNVGVAFLEKNNKLEEELAAFVN